MSNTITNKNDLFSLFEEVFQDWAEGGKALTEMSDKARRKEAEQFLLSLPKFTPTEAWGNPQSTGRKTINRLFSVVGGGAVRPLITTEVRYPDSSTYLHTVHFQGRQQGFEKEKAG